MRVLYFGTYDPGYARNRVLIRGLKQNGVEVTECRSNSKGLSKFFDLLSKHWELKSNYDLVIVGFLGHQIVPFAKLIISKPIITADTPAIRELFDDNDIYLVASEPGALASAILKLKKDAKLRESLADNAHNKFKKFATPEMLGNQLKQIAAESLK